MMTLFKVDNLRCEYKENPLGIDIQRPRFSWHIVSEARACKQVAYQLQVSSSADFTESLWDSGKVISQQSVHVQYDGPPFTSRSRYFYRVRVWDQASRDSGWSAIAFFETGLLLESDWQADWVAENRDLNPVDAETCSYLRKEFRTTRSVQQARIYATSLGMYELYLNGQRVGDWLLTPGWTSYATRIQYQTYDVTDLLNEGQNTLGVTLGDGWYRGEIGWTQSRTLYGNERAVILQLHIEYEDGQEKVLTSDATWTSTSGPIRMSEIYHGELYDARLEMDGWSSPGFIDTGWHPVRVVPHGKDMLVAQENLPTQVVAELTPVAVIHAPNGDTLLDMGQNMVGRIRFQVNASEGTMLTLEHAEVLDKEGNFYTRNLRKAKQTVRYVCSGQGTEVFEPHFTFQGFRYVRISGFPDKIQLHDFCGRVISTNLPQTGSFVCSNKMVNQLQQNILWGQRGNFVDVPTDCPQRDERLGWTGDAQVFIRTAAFNMNIAPFFTKWLHDLKADQLLSGSVPVVIPNVLRGESNHSSSAWGDASTVCPWTLYLCYGDERVLEEQYDSMRRWVDYIRSQGENEYLWNTGFHYGDWLALDTKEGSYVGATAKDYIATAFYAYSTGLLVRAAEILGKEDDVAAYRSLQKHVIDHFRNEFVSPNGRLSEPTQTAHVLALMFDLVEEKHRQRIVETLVGNIRNNQYHLTTGFVGTPYLCHVLSKNGYHDVACKLILQTDCPSWLYPITKGATTIWEHWDGIKEDGSFWSDDMNSFNHYAYGSVGDWLYRVLAGIDTDEHKPGYQHIHFHPHPGYGFEFADASFISMYGQIKSTWKLLSDERKMEITVHVPPNATGTVMLPFASEKCIYESGVPIEHVKHGVGSYTQTETGVKVEIGSGEYQFSYLVPIDVISPHPGGKV